MKELMNLMLSWNKAVSELPEEDRNNLMDELNQIKNSGDGSGGFYQPIKSDGKPIPPTAK